MTPAKNGVNLCLAGPFGTLFGVFWRLDPSRPWPPALLLAVRTLTLIYLLTVPIGWTLADGLPDPDDPATQREALHWAFRPLVHPQLPAARDPHATGQSPIDRFVLARLEDAGLAMSREADRATLIRRICYDLTGLPPTPEAILAFQADHEPDAYQRMVDRYLASPRYGVRWSKYWLDAAGYADSNGYFAADTNRPLAYRYRDWVIRALNSDKPYDLFVREQLAGDELAGYRPDGDVTGQTVDLLTATHFLRNAQDGTGSSDGNPDEVRIDRYTVLEGTLEITMNSLLGVTIQCARCHDHKFEPVTQREYYSLQAIFFGAYNPDRWAVPDSRVVTIGRQDEKEAHRLQMAEIDERIGKLQKELQSAGLPHRKVVIHERLKDLVPDQLATVLAAWETAQADRSDAQTELVETHKEALDVSDDELAKRFAEFASTKDRIEEQIKQQEQQRPAPLEQIAVLVDLDADPAEHHVLLHGQHHDPGPVVSPDVPVAIAGEDHRYEVTNDDRPGSSGRRLAFARWVASPANPLFARVMVNRVWMHHFGQGLVTTPANLGLSGALPSHPELLDYLAAEFIRTGWSIKRLHRLILSSDVYRQESSPREDGLATDRDNRLLWRYTPRRLTAEAVRDGMLFVSSQLDETMDGPYVPIAKQGDGMVVVQPDHPGARRRSVYLQQRRTQMPSMLELFDAPAMVTSCPQRSTSTVPLQSLAMLNSQFIRDCAGALARRLQREVTAGDRQRIERALLLAAGRAARTTEIDASMQFLEKQRTVYAEDPDAEKRVWTDYCQMLLASSGVLYVE